MAKIAAAAKAVTESENYKKRWLQSQFHVVPEFHGDPQKLIPISKMAWIRHANS